MAMRPEEELDREVMRGMARHLWVHAYMLWATQVEAPPQPGQSWEEMTPDNASTRAASRQAAQELRAMIGSSNRLSGQHILGRLFIWAVDAQPGKRKRATTEADLAFAFGEDLAGLCMGTLEPEDSVLPIPARFVLPHFSVQLDDDGSQISWDGGVSYAGDEVDPTAPTKQGCGCHPNPGGLEILVIEDEDIVQKMYPRLLRKLYKGAEVFVVDNYDAAIGYLKTHDIKLVISDVDILGDKSGIDVFEWVKAHQPHLVDRYVFVTGGNPHVADLHYRYVEKPFMPEELWEAVRRQAPEPGAGARAPARHTTTPPPRTAAAAPARARTTTAKPKTAAATKRTHDEMVAYADHIHDLAAHRGTRFGDRKVFLGSIPGWDLHDPTLLADLDQLRRARLIELARADLVAAMDPALVRASEWNMDGAAYHFLVLPEKYRQAAAAPATSAMDLATFARIVKETGAKVPRTERGGRAYGRLGDKVFISAIWRLLSPDPRFRGMDMPTFKRRLIEANRHRLLDLQRLDLSGAADLGEQTESLIEDLGSEFHTVHIDDAPRRNPAVRRPRGPR